MTLINRYTTQTIPPTCEPISLAQAKRQLRVDGTDDDDFIRSLISAARNYVEYQCNTQLVLAKFVQTLDHFPCGTVISLNYAPLIDVESITYVDSAGDTQTLSTDVYSVLTTEKPGKIKLKYGQFWPVTRCQPDAVSITFRAGYARPFTAAVTDVITMGSSEPAEIESFPLSTTDGSLPGGLSTGVVYDTHGLPGTTCSFRLAGGASDINITSTGSGTHFVGVIPEAAIHAMLLLISFWYTTRNATMEGGFVPPQVGYLLSSVRWGGQ